MFGGNPICPRCQNSVYAAEQVMGPARKFYHKPCLVCTTCNKRLDSLQLLEHDQEPYCRSCHVKNFGTRDLRHANLTSGSGSLSTPSSPAKVKPISTMTSPPRQPPTLSSPTRTSHDHEQAINTSDRSLSPPPTTLNLESNPDKLDSEQTSDREEVLGWTPTNGTSNATERPLHSNSRNVDILTPLARLSISAPSPLNKLRSPLVSTSTGTPLNVGSPSGTRYGAALTGQATGGSTRNWGGTTPACGKCGKNVYFAEQVRASGKIYHKGCLRCTECNTLLDSTRLTEKDGNLLCRRCYGKLHGPQGSGYALLGKAGG